MQSTEKAQPTKECYAINTQISVVEIKLRFEPIKWYPPPYILDKWVYIIKLALKSLKHHVFGREFLPTFDIW